MEPMKLRSKNFVIFLVLLSAIALVVSRSTGNAVSSDALDHARSCQENLKTLATAMEMYATDNNGRYPDDISKLLPTYLASEPICPSAGRDTYTEGFQVGAEAPQNKEGWQDYYYIACSGHNHAEANLDSNLPAVDCTLGVVPKLPFSGSPQEARDACAQELKQLATAMEMYSVDWQGVYPDDLSKLKPNYLAAMPTCPVSMQDTYSQTFEHGIEAKHNTQKHAHYYYFACSGKHDGAQPSAGPEYDSVLGLYK